MNVYNSDGFHNSNQRGAILVFFAIALVALLGFVALVIDTGIGEGGRSEEQTSAQNASLAGMSAYLAALKTPSNQQAAARTQARIWAERILDSSDRVTEGFRETPNTDVSLSVGNPGGDGTITFGRMVWAAPTPTPGQEPGPSDDVTRCGGAFPCFIPFGPQEQGNSATALELVTNSQRNPLRTLFARLFGMSSYPIGASAIATLIPQNYLFLVDLSMSMTDQSHRRIGARNSTCTSINPPECTDGGWSGHPKCYHHGSGGYFGYELDADAIGGGCVPGGSFSPATPGCECITARDDTSCFKLARTGGTEIDELGTLGQPWSERRFAWRVFNGYSDFWSKAEAPKMQVKACREVDDSPLFGGQCQSDSDPKCLSMYGTGGSFPASRAFGASNYLLRRQDRYRVVSQTLGTDLVTGVPSESGVLGLVDFGGTASSTAFAGNPEPLTSVLSAAHSAMEFIGNRSVAADRFLLAGFDESLFAARSTCATHTTGTALDSTLDCDQGNSLVSTSSDSFRNFLDLTNSSRAGWANYSSGDKSHFINRWFFPRQGFNTDLQLALWKAYDELAAATVAPNAKNLVFIVTDGLVNCGFNSSPATPNFRTLEEYLDNRTCESAASIIGPKVIQSVYQIGREPIRRQQSGAVKSLVQLFTERKIAVSIILIGNNVRPHHIVRKSLGSTSGCMSNSEALYGGVTFVDWGMDRYCTDQTCKTFHPALENDARAALTDPSGPVALTVSNLLYEELVAPTRGAWIPIMPTLTDSSGAAVNFNSALQQACTSAPSMPGSIDTLSPRLRNTTLNIGGSSYRVTDAQGRLLYDPLARSQRDQIIEQVRGVLGGGFVLVEPLSRAQ